MVLADSKDFDVVSMAMHLRTGESTLPKFEVRYMELEPKVIKAKSGGPPPNIPRTLWVLMLQKGKRRLYSPEDVVARNISRNEDPTIYENCKGALEVASYRKGRRVGDEVGPDNQDPNTGQLFGSDGKPTNVVMWRAEKWQLVITDEAHNAAVKFMEKLKAFADGYPKGTRFYLDFKTLELSAVEPQTRFPKSQQSEELQPLIEDALPMETVSENAFSKKLKTISEKLSDHSSLKKLRDYVLVAVLIFVSLQIGTSVGKTSKTRRITERIASQGPVLTAHPNEPQSEAYYGVGWSAYDPSNEPRDESKQDQDFY